MLEALLESESKREKIERERTSEMTISKNNLTKDIEVYYEKGSRNVKCFCGVICNKSIIPHIVEKHPEAWNDWCKDFVKQYNKGLSYKRIMNLYRDRNGRLLFTWTVVERYIKRMIEKGESKLLVRQKEKIKTWRPEKFKVEKTSVWDFPKRGDWAVHQSDYRGNWPPQLPRNLILKYSGEGDLILDPFVGGGTTLIEAWLENRKSIGIDINPIAEQVSKQRILEMELKSKESINMHLSQDYKPIIVRDDARNVLKIMSKIGLGTDSIDLLLMHPPYMDALRYTELEKEDLSHLHDVNLFCQEIQGIARDLFSLLKSGKKCALLIGDIRKNGRMIPLGFRVMECFLKEKYDLLDIIMKTQHRDQSTEFYYNKPMIEYLIAHEYLFIFQKP